LRPVQPDVSADAGDACAPVDAETLRAMGDFVERMRGMGAAGVRIGGVAVQFAPQMEIPKHRPGSSSRDETLYHSS
jgi:hypothetical protein